ncbi:MAG: NADH-quinone oxidoreductase subunit N [Bacteroidetes bacterium]|nr:NADH-quinone oxidoreductase subunit N [Bacteroidota bacterium]
MNLDNFLLMRHELVLTIITLIVLIADLSIKEDKKQRIIPIAIFLFGVNAIIGFFPVVTGNLFGNMYKISDLQCTMKNVLNIGVFIILLQSVEWLKSTDNKLKISEFYLLIFSTLIGMQFMISAGSFLMLYLGLELATIPMAALAAYDKSRSTSAEAGVKLILSAAMSSAVLLLGITFIYGTTGSTYFDVVSLKFSNNPLQTLAFILFFSGMAFKISLVPFHLWTADVYEGSPVNVTSYLSVISKGASAFILIIVLFSVFNSISMIWKPLMYIISVLTMTIGNLFAIRQQNMKRFLAFSSIAQAGFILLGIIGANGVGMTSVIYFIFIYIFSNLGAFGVVSVIYYKTKKENMDDYDGLYLTNPKLSLVMMLALFSLAGIPPVAGFFGKFFLFTAAATSGYYWLVFIAVLNATISLYYYLLVVKAMFINKSDNPIAYFKTDAPAKAALIMCVVGIFFIGFLSVIYSYMASISYGI